MRPRKVLVVEDSVSTRAFVRVALEASELASRWGQFEVVEASSGFEAMRLLPRGPYDLIITDINMGDINGLELIRFVRQSAHHASTPLLIVSTQRRQSDVDRGLALGADAYLSKPFTAEELRSTCERLLDASLATAQPSS